MNPVLVEVWRNREIESQHRGAVVAVDVAGNRLLQAGDVEKLVFPRSALKPIQAIPLLEDGAADHFALTSAEIALSCASHNAEPVHIAALEQWMARLHVTPEDLECGEALPLYQPAAHALVAQGRAPGRHHHNCSGKHTGMLTLARFHGEALTGYSGYRHRTQQLWMSALQSLTGLDVPSLPWDLDGCGLPALALPLASLATAYARLAEPAADPAIAAQRSRAIERICAAMQRHPELVAGTDRCCTAVMQQVDGLTVKTGAEGVFGAVSHRHGVGIALKIDDGGTRGAEVALGAVLRKLGLIEEDDYQALERHFFPPVRNSQQRVTGAVRPSAHWN